MNTNLFDRVKPKETAERLVLSPDGLKYESGHEIQAEEKKHRRRRRDTGGFGLLYQQADEAVAPSPIRLPYKVSYFPPDECANVVDTPAQRRFFRARKGLLEKLSQWVLVAVIVALIFALLIFSPSSGG